MCGTCTQIQVLPDYRGSLRRSPVYAGCTPRMWMPPQTLLGAERDACAAIGKSVNMWHIKQHYFTSHPRLNYYAIVPVGGKPWWEEPHDRVQKFP